MKKLASATIDAALLTKLHAKTPEKQRVSWDYTRGYARTFKDAITSQMITIQSNRCAYCGSRLHGTKHHRDHVAPKETYPEFTFFPANLVLACYYCNTDCKGAFDTVATKNADYEKCIFKIIHPQLDNPGDHIQFVGGVNMILVQIVDGSAKGTATVALFHLDSPEMTKQRAKDAEFDDDLEHLPGRWREGFIHVRAAHLKMKIRSTL